MAVPNFGMYVPCHGTEIFLRQRYNFYSITARFLQYILTFLYHIANTYINNEVLLSDGSSGKIVLINKKLTRPTIQLDNGNFINLESRLDLYVQAII